MDAQSKEVQELQRLVETMPAEPANAIIWLQGDRFDRGGRVLELFQAKLAPVIVVTGNNQLVGEGAKEGENNIPASTMQQWLVEHGVPAEAIVLDDQSMNTRDQAVQVLGLASDRKWNKLLLVGSRQHQLRPLLTFLKRAEEVAWWGKIICQPAMFNWSYTPAGQDKTASEAFHLEIEKLTRHAGHVVSVKRGIEYLRQFV